MLDFKNSNETFWLIFKQCEVIYIDSSMAKIDLKDSLITVLKGSCKTKTYYFQSVHLW